MARYRQFHTSFWSDSYIETLSVEDRYFYTYLLTNPYTTYCGVYEITDKKMSDQTGFTKDAIAAILKRFEDSEKIIYDRATNEMCIVNWGKYNAKSAGKPIKDAMDAEFKRVKNKGLLRIVRKKIDNEHVRKYFDEHLNKTKEDKEESILEYNDTSTIRKNDAKKKTEEHEKTFEAFRLAYPSTKRGLKTEFEYFRKQHTDWKKVIDKLLPALKAQMAEKERLKSNPDSFIEEWKHLKTWIYQRHWEYIPPPPKEDSGYKPKGPTQPV